MSALAKNPSLGHITTFGGHPVCVAAALATLKILHHQSYVCEVSAKEILIRTLLLHPLIKTIRSSGLMLAVELNDAKHLTPVIDAAIRNGVLIDYFLFDQTSFRIAPPLIITTDQIIEGVQNIIAALDEVNQNIKK